MTGKSDMRIWAEQRSAINRRGKDGMMMWRSLTVIVSCCVLACPALAAHCDQPYAPSVSASEGSTEAQIRQMRDDVQSFIEASDLYQKCLTDSARTDHTLGNRLADLLAANQHDKERAGEAINAVIKAYNSGKAGLLKTSDARN